MHTFRKGGVHPPEYKITAGTGIKTVELPREVVLTFAQHIGAPAACSLVKGDKVVRGQEVAQAGGFVSAAVHSPITGTVTTVGQTRNAYGQLVATVAIAADEADHEADLKAIADAKPARTAEQINDLQAKEIIDIVAQAGIVGLGGATFPTRVKLSPPPGSKADIVIINAVECEPFLTNDHALMLAKPDEIITGVKLLMKAAGVDRAVIGIEANKPDAIALLAEKAASAEGIEVMPLKVKYPQGGEKQLIKAVTGREVPAGALPIATGAIVQNVATAYAVYEAVVWNKPLIERVITVTGPSVSNPGNYLVPLGYPIAKLVEMAGGVPSDTGKILFGGPMMGRAVTNLDTPTIKGISGVLMLPQSMSERNKPEPCIRCASCVSACPMGLQPYLISTLARLGQWEQVEVEGVMNCIECGCCSYTCPSSRPLLDYIRLGKMTVGGIIRARAQKQS
ncbi:MAG: electron transport complex subunit RsxC [Muribaculum sp.]|nr:electron transport complex subunit RsxC [Muribaculaceae bacterium]MCM1080525.1 electron transport complex subunit RsxC [Muribaculum sp.]